ncbi:MAG: hypothetical protein HKN87_20265 [Saprospiraceae bacterium]|nr:hypothetical protein [Saprospiraceae bacterium]
MIKFSRKIRRKWVFESNFGKYLKYAIGEILLDCYDRDKYGHLREGSVKFEATIDQENLDAWNK